METGRRFWSGRRVTVTGHTGFKGTWLCHWLCELGAEVTGIGLAPPVDRPSLFAETELARRIESRIQDVRDRGRLGATLRAAEPEVLFHLAAQPLVFESLEDPLGTFQSNVMGVANLLDAARHLPSLRAVVVVTSDKCYSRPERPCREDDPLGGHDPYSASKACAEIVAEAYRACFYRAEAGVGLATARAGNVIGGGDLSPGRLLPDIVQAFAAGETARLRHPAGVRPWQHVLDALSGYLLLAERLAADPQSHATAWNFGPKQDPSWTAGRVATAAAARFGRGSWLPAGTESGPEVPTLLLCSDRARRKLGWRPRLATQDAVAWTVDGYQAFLAGEGVGWLLDQIQAFEDLATADVRKSEPRHAFA
jgi:CDP-glucose 4,6-dehydratase